MNGLLKQEEQAVYALRALYRSHGYSRFKMSKFEAYDLYAKNKDFLVSEGVITFTDTDGTLMALKPDVTLSIVKNYRNEPGCVQKVYYNENVYRIAGASHSYREIMQTGLECLGDIGLFELCEVILLAAKSLQTISEHYILDLSHIGIVAEVLENLPLSQAEKADVCKCIGEKNEDGLRALCSSVPQELLEQLLALIHIYGPMDQALKQMSAFAGSTAMQELQTVAATLKQLGLSEHINLDFSIVGDQNYYNGFVFRGYVEGIPSSILSGGQYDRLMVKMGKQAGGVGFAVYLDELERLNAVAKRYDVDDVLLYNNDADVQALLQEAEQFRSGEEKLLVIKQLPAKLKYRRLLRYENGRIELVEDNG